VSQTPIERSIRSTLEQYFQDLRGTEPGGVHEMIIRAAERPMLEVVMRHARGNQTLAAQVLGISRNTLHKKLLQHGLDG